MTLRPAALAAALRKVRPDAAPTVLGRHKVFRFRTVIPACTFESVLLMVGGGRAVELTARDSFDERLAVFLLDQAVEIPLPGRWARTIRVVPSTFPAPWTFSTVVAVPPSVAGRFIHESTALRLATYWLVPAFTGEFTDRSSGDDFWHQVRRKDGWNSTVIRWDRTPKTSRVFDA